MISEVPLNYLLLKLRNNNMKNNQIKKSFVFFTLLILLTAFIHPGYASTGFKFPLKRYVYPESNKNGISITLSNNTDIPYLIESWVSSADSETYLPVKNIPDDKVPFIILPPLKKINAHTEFSWSIRRTGVIVNGEPLPDDRESLFWIGMKAIPSESKDKNNGVFFKVSPEFYFKLLYRPKSIEHVRLQDVEDSLVITRTGNQLSVNNPSPLFITFDQLLVGTTELKNGDALITIKPFSVQMIDLPESEKNKVITWRISDENLFELTTHTVK